MKQTFFMILLTLIGTLGTVTVSPFCGVAIYYLFAILRPQFLWEWALPPGVAWSFYVALAVIFVSLAHFVGLLTYPRTKDQQVLPTPQLSVGHGIFFAFACWVVLTYFTAYDRELAYPFLIEYLKIFVMYLLSSFLVRTFRQIWVLFILAAFILGYIAYEVNYIYVFNNRYTLLYSRGYGGLDNNGAALMLAMGVPLCFFVWEGIARWYRWAFLVPIPLIIHAVLMSYSRGAMLALVVSTPIYLWRSRHRFQALGFSAVIAMLLPFMAGKEIQARFFSISDHEVDASANSRKRSWETAWNMALDYPVFGMGIRNSFIFMSQYGYGGNEQAIHSLYLQYAADSGFIGMGLYLLSLGSAWVSVYRVQRATARQTDPTLRRAHGVACGIEGAMLVFCVGASFLSLEHFELPYLLLMMAVQLPIVLRSAVVEKPQPAGSPPWSPSRPEIRPQPVGAS